MPDKKMFLNSGPSSPDLPKSTFDKSFTNHLTARFGRLYPCFVEEAVAGSTYTIKPDMAFDLMPMAFPIQSNMRAHLSMFKVPFRILMKSYKDYFSRVGDHVMPYIDRPAGWHDTGSLADYMGIPSFSADSVSRELSVGFTGRFRLLPDSLSYSYFLSQLSPSYVQYLDFQPLNVYFQSVNSSVVSSSSNDSFFCALSEYVVHPFTTDYLYLSVVHSVAISNPQFMIGVFCSRKGVGGSPAQLLFFTGASSGSRYYTASSSDIEGRYTASVVSSVTGNEYNPSYTFHRYNVHMRSADVEALNSLISSGEYDVRLAIIYGSSYAHILGDSPFGFSLPEGRVDVRNMPMIDPRVTALTINKDGESDVYETTAGVQSTLSSSFAYDAGITRFGTAKDVFANVNGAPPKLPINALPFRAYEFIYNKYFRNQQVDPFYKDGEISYNEFLTNDGDGADSTTPIDFFNVPYEYDEFTTALKSPQAGFAPLVGVTTNDETGIGYLDMVPLVDGEPDVSQAYKIGVRYSTDNGAITAVTNYDEVADKPSVMRLTEAIDFGISINDFRNVSAFQRMKEKMLKAGYQYQDLVKEFFGTTAPIGEEFPEYLGGMTRDVFVGKIQNQALTDEHPLGEFAGVGGVTGSGKAIKCFCSEQSYIIGVLWFSVTPIYSQAIPKHFLKHHPLDYFNPTLNAIGPQPIYRHELAPLQLDEEDLMDVFGYQRPWYDYVSRRDECHGAFRGSMRNYLLQRFFLECPELTENFINIHSEELTDVFTVQQDTDKFYGLVRYDVKCKSPVARISVPRIIG